MLFSSVTYRQLQQAAKVLREYGLTTIKLNSKRVVLEKDLNRVLIVLNSCESFELNQNMLEALPSFYIEAIVPQDLTFESESLDPEVKAAVAESWTDYEQSSSVGDFSDVPDLEPHELDKLAERYGFPAVTAAHAVALFLIVMCTLVLWAIDAPVVIYRTVHAVWHAASNFYNGLVDAVVESYALVEFPALVEFL